MGSSAILLEFVYPTHYGHKWSFFLNVFDNKTKIKIKICYFIWDSGTNFLNLHVGGCAHEGFKSLPLFNVFNLYEHRVGAMCIVLDTLQTLYTCTCRV